MTPKSLDLFSEIIYYDKTEHDNLTLKDFIKLRTSYHKYSFLLIDVENDKYESIEASHIK